MKKAENIYNMMKEHRREVILCTAFGFLISAFVVVGYYVWNELSVTGVFENIFSSIMSFIIMGILYTGITFAVFTLIKALMRWCGGASFNFLRKPLPFRLIWMIIFVCWLPCYLAFCPGVYVYDIDTQTNIIYGVYSISNVQPLIHTIWWYACLLLENYTGIKELALIAYSVSQMLVISSVLAYCIQFLWKQNCHPLFVWLTMFYYAGSPRLALFSITTTKDIVFSGLFLLITLRIVSLIKDEELFHNKAFLFSFFMESGFFCLFRSNAVYILAALALCIGIRWRKKAFYVVIELLVIVLLHMAMTGPFFRHFEIANSPKHEALSVPISQLANVYINYPESLNEEESRLIREYIPDVQKYNPRIADRVKSTFDDGRYYGNSKEFWKLWSQVFLKAPKAYIDAFLSLNISYWYPFAEIIDPISEKEYIGVGNDVTVNLAYEKSWNGWLPRLNKWYKRVSVNDDLIARIPVIGWFTTLSAPVYIVLLLTIFLICIKKYRLLWMLLPGLLLLGTYIPGPTCLYRYLLPLIYSIPVYFAILLKDDVSE